MKQLSWMFSFIICYSLFVSCNADSSQQFEFYYYPSRNIYFDLTKNIYFYSLDGGHTWDSLKNASDKEPATLGAKQIIYSTTPAVWVDNAEHRREFNAQVVDVLNSDSSITSKDIVEERKIKKTAAVTTTSTKKPEKKLNFFQRLFGKKNK